LIFKDYTQETGQKPLKVFSCDISSNLRKCLVLYFDKINRLLLAEREGVVSLVTREYRTSLPGYTVDDDGTLTPSPLSLSADENPRPWDRSPPPLWDQTELRSFSDTLHTINIQRICNYITKCTQIQIKFT